MARKYDKGEKRFKHEGSRPQPEVHFVRGRAVGKCPAGMPAGIRNQLLNEAIAAPIGDRDIDYPKYLYVVHEGAIYEARTSDAGISYHGFPYRGKMNKAMLAELRAMAETKNCLGAFEKWVKEHIWV